MRDISDQKRREQELRRERDINEQLVRTVPVPVSIASADGETLMANQRAQDLLGLSEEEFIDAPDDAEEWKLYDEHGTLHSPELSPTARVVTTGEPVFNQEIAIERPTGERIWVSVNAPQYLILKVP